MASTRENTPHDESYKLLFSHQEMVESLIRDFVPEEQYVDTSYACFPWRRPNA